MMKILVYDEGRRYTFHLPLFFIKSRFVAKAIAKDGEYKLEAKSLQKCIKTAYKGLKSYIKENGHFTLVEVKEKDGDSVIIRV